MLKLITILGDPLALPRPEVSYTDGHPARLSLHLGNEFLVVNKARRNNTVVKQSSLAGEGYAWEEIIYMHESRYFIIHLGIVDCAPRIFSLDERRLLGILRRLPSGGYITNYIRDIRSTHRRFFTKHFPKVYVDKKAFATGLSAILSMIQTKTSATRAFIINIADTSSVAKHRSFGFAENIRDYNEIIGSVSQGYPDKVSVIGIYAETAKDRIYFWQTAYILRPRDMGS